MIVRVSGEGQYRLAEGLEAQLNEFDNAAVEAVEADNEGRFQDAFKAMLDAVRRAGTQLADDDLSPSDLILPPADLSFEEAKQEFTGEGLLPG